MNARMRNSKSFQDAVEVYEQFYAQPWSETFSIEHLWPSDNRFAIVDRMKSTNYLSNKWQEDEDGNLKEDEDSYIAYKHIHDESPRPYLLDVPKPGETCDTRIVRPPQTFALSFLGYALDGDLCTPGSRGQAQHIDWKHGRHLPWLCWWKSKKCLVIFNTQKQDSPTLIMGPTLRVGPRGIEG